MSGVVVENDAQLANAQLYTVQTKLCQVQGDILGFGMGTKPEKLFTCQSVHAQEPVEFVPGSLITLDLWTSVALCPTIEQTGALIDGELVKEHRLLFGWLVLKFFFYSLHPLLLRLTIGISSRPDVHADRTSLAQLKARKCGSLSSELANV